MSIQIGYIENITGDATVTSANGTTADLTQNTALSENDIITTGANATVIVKLSDGSSITVGPNQSMTLDKTVHDSEELSQDETQAEVDSLKAILAESPDLSVFEETASGETVAIGGSSVTVDSFVHHNENLGDASSSMLENVVSATPTPYEEDDRFGLPIDDTPVTITISNILTNDNTPTVSGTINDPEAQIVITVDGNDYTATNNGDGTWTLPSTDPISDGDTVITVVAIDPAGNTTTETATITVDTVAPTVTVDTTPTNDTTPTISGTTNDPDANIVVTIGGNDYTATNNGDGTWTVPSTDTLAEGDTAVTVVATDPAGNTTTIDDTITIDTTEPTVAINDLVTNDTTPAISGTTDDATATIVVTVGGTDYTAVNNGNGTWTLADDTITALTPGENTILVTATDPAGNTSTATTTTGSITIDTIAPTVTINDLITNDTTPAISGTTDDATAIIVVTVGGSDYTAVNNGNGTWTLADDTITALTPGENTILVTATDPAGNSSTATTTTGSITIDTTAPAVTIDDLVTNDTTPTITGSTDDATATIVVTIDGKTYDAIVNSDGTWSVTLPDGDALSDNDYVVSVTATDPVGNETKETNTITIDTNNNDSGDHTITLHEISDNYINMVETQTEIIPITGTTTSLNGVVTIFVNGVEFGQTTAVNGLFTMDIPAGTFTQADVDGKLLFPDGNYEVVASVLADAAGNLVTSTQTVVLDTTLTDIPNAVNPSNGGDNDNGGNLVTIDSIEDLTGQIDFSGGSVTTDDKTIIIKGTVDSEDDTRLILTIDGVVYTPVINGKEWTLDLTGEPLSADTHEITAQIVDVAGNHAEVTKDLVITPVTGSLNIESITDDTGLNGTDFITQDTTLVIAGSIADNVNNTVEVTIDGTTYTTADSELTLNADGTWSLDITSNPLNSDGDYVLTVNEINPDSTVAGTVTQTITTDNSGPVDDNNSNNGDVVTIGSITDDTGIDNNDFITTDKELLIEGTFDNENGNRFDLTINGTPYDVVISGNNWSLDLQGTTLADGTYTVIATVTDIAGNQVSEQKDIIIDNIINPSEGDITISLDEISNNFINLDETASDNLVIISGTTINATDGTIVTIRVEGQIFTTAVVTNDTFSIEIPKDTFNDTTLYPDGTYDVSAEVIADAAGNVSIDHETVLLDRSNSDNNGNGNGIAGADATVTLDAISGGNINIEESSQGVTITGTTTLVAGNDPEHTIIIEFNGKTYIATPVGDNVSTTENTFSVSIPAADLALLNDASTYTVTATVIADKAGNTISDTEDVTTDFTAPVVTVADLDTQDTTPGFNGSVDDPTAIVVVTVGGSNYTAVNDGIGGWSLADDVIDALTPGEIDITVTATDLSGNEASATTSTGTIIIDGFPVAFDNVDKIDLANSTTTSGNVITDEYNSKTDTLGDGTTTLSSITYNGTSYTFTNGSLTINTTYGEMIFQDDGSYGYTYAGPDSVLTGGNTIDLWNDVELYAYQDSSFIQGGLLDIGSLAAHTSNVSENSLGLGVKDDGSWSSNDSIDGDDALILEFGDNITEVKLNLNDTSFFNFFAGVSIGVYDENGVLLDQIDTFSFISFFGSADETIQIDMGDVAFKYVVIESSSDVYLDEISYTPAVTTTTDVTETFTYEIIDSDGDTSTANLIIDGNDNTILYDSNALVHDGGLGTDTLILTTTDDLDFSNISNLQNMEIIDLAGADHTVSNLTVQDVVDMTDANNELFIYGDAGDNVALEPTLIDQNTTVTNSDGKTFDVFSDAGNTVTVNIEQEIIVS